MQHLIVIDLSSLTSKMLPKIQATAQAFRIQPEEMEPLFDWLINQAMSNVMYLEVKGHLKNHFPNDVFKLVHDTIGYELEAELLHLFNLHRLLFINHETVKTLVTYHQLLVVRSFTEGSVHVTPAPSLPRC